MILVVIHNDKVEDIIKKIKSSKDLDDVRFVKAYNGKLKETPLGGILVTVNNGVNMVNSFAGGFAGNGMIGENIKSELKLNIYCPYQNGGDGITHTINSIVESLPKADSENIVSGISVSEIKYSQEYEAVYRTLSLSLDYLDYRGE